MTDHRKDPFVTSDQVAVYACRAAAVSAFAGGTCLTIAGRARRAHTRTPQTGRAHP